MEALSSHQLSNELNVVVIVLEGSALLELQISLEVKKVLTC